MQKIKKIKDLQKNLKINNIKYNGVFVGYKW